MAKAIGIFGGSFNPPHIAHLIIAESIRDQFNLDRITWVPNFVPPHKSNAEMADAIHRLQMTQLAVAENPAFEVLDIEIKREGTSYTVDTLQVLKNSYPKDQIHLILGGDSLEDFMGWHKPDEIVRMAPLLVYRRNPATQRSEAETLYPERISFVDAPFLDISSTALRERIKENRTIRYFVPDSVRDYIYKHRLYR